MRRAYLFRWWRHAQVDIRLRRDWLSLGLDRRQWPWRLVAYRSPDATPMHPQARGWKGWN